MEWREEQLKIKTELINNWKTKYPTENGSDNNNHSTEIICIDENGSLFIKSIKDNGKIFFSNPLFSVNNLHLKILDTKDTDIKIYLLEWDGCIEPVKLSKLSVTEFIRCLEQNEAKFTYGRDKVRQNVKIIIPYLIINAEVIDSPNTFGWYKKRDGKWEFFDERHEYYKYLAD